MRRLFALLFALTLLLAGCGGDDDAGSGADPGGDAGATADGGSGDDGGGADPGADGDVAGTITIQDFAYGEPLTVPPGALIRVVNMDSAQHDVDAVDGTSFNTDLLGQGEELTFTAPTEEGTYEITCSVHPEMSGQLMVSA